MVRDHIMKFHVDNPKVNNGAVFAVCLAPYFVHGGWDGKSPNRWCVYVKYRAQKHRRHGYEFLTEKALRKTRHCMMPSIVSPVKQKVPLRCRPLRPITEQRLACTKAFCDRVAAVRAGWGSEIVSMILQLLRPRLSASISLEAPSLSKHPVSAGYPCRVVHAGLTHEVAKARALDTMAHCRERKRSRGSHGEVITETKHGPCEQTPAAITAIEIHRDVKR
ncbi:hypothetical protein ALC53_05703 [Atta colombica]|uniref:Uncharacterized protein n=1 Tax=Atta colombica TaxID=520822 RepID=A0A195BGQ7_9HYME|nr:hypothetical protein ALC53_05703 [Atta colombica]